MSYFKKMQHRPFAVACFDDNSPYELLEALVQSPDPFDCASWDITPDEWRISVKIALGAQIECLKEKIGND